MRKAVDKSKRKISTEVFQIKNQYEFQELSEILQVNVLVKINSLILAQTLVNTKYVKLKPRATPKFHKARPITYEIDRLVHEIVSILLKQVDGLPPQSLSRNQEDIFLYAKTESNWQFSDRNYTTPYTQNLKKKKIGPLEAEKLVVFEPRTDL